MPAKRTDASDAAREVWASIKRRNPRFTGKSPVDGLAERIRSAKAPRPINPAKRDAERLLSERRRITHYKANRLPYRTPVGGGLNLPIHGDRETSRRRRQINAGSLRSENGLALAHSAAPIVPQSASLLSEA